MVAGAVIGGVTGVLAAVALDRGADDREERTQELDRIIGVSGGDMGAPSLRHPPGGAGAFYAASSGAEPPPGPVGPKPARE